MEQTKPGIGQTNFPSDLPAYRLDHIALEAHDVKASVEWHIKELSAERLYEDDTWALLRLADGTKVALVSKGQHPPHIGIVPSREPFGDLKAHRDGSYSFYQKDPYSRAVYEWIWYPDEGVKDRQ